MPRAIWNGSISFGLVTIPVKLVTAVRESEGVHFHYLHAKDKARIKNTRTCEIDGEEVPWNEVVRGYEYEKGEYVVVTEAELKKMQPEATQTPLWQRPTLPPIVHEPPSATPAHAAI